MKSLIFVLLLISQSVFSISLDSTSRLNPFSLPSYYHDNMMLQRAPYNSIIWGFADTSSIIGTTILQKLYTTVAEKVDWSDRYVWTIKLDPISSDQPMNIELTETRPDGFSNIKINNVLFGDIWVCSGQSNMQMSLANTFNGTEEINNGFKYDKIRLLTTSLIESPTPVYDLKGIQQRWSIPSAASLGNGGWSYFSGTCWHFGKKLSEELNTPIGLIVTSWGGTNVERWTTTKVIDDCKGARNGNDQVLWNSMINPFFKYTIFGAIWYQGESNTGYNRDFYDCIFPGMIENWRQNWYQGTRQSTSPNFPFGFVQLANSNTETTSIGGYPVIRWRQTANFGYVPNSVMKNVFMGSAVDLVDNGPDPIHPRDKTNVGGRLALGALNLAYNKNVEYYSPRVSSITYANSIATILFESEFKPISLRVVNKNGFEVCCNNDNCPIDNANNWKSIADFNVLQDKLNFNLPTGCNSLKSVRYAWRQKPCEYQACALYSTSSNLPIYPFFYQF